MFAKPLLQWNVLSVFLHFMSLLANFVLWPQTFLIYWWNLRISNLRDKVLWILENWNKFKNNWRFSTFRVYTSNSQYVPSGGVIACSWLSISRIIVLLLLKSGTFDIYLYNLTLWLKSTRKLNVQWLFAANGLWTNIVWDLWMFAVDGSTRSIGPISLYINDMCQSTVTD